MIHAPESVSEMINAIRVHLREVRQVRRQLDGAGVGSAELVALLYNFMGDPACDQKGGDMLACARKIGEALDMIEAQLDEALTIAKRAAQVFAEHQAKAAAQMSRLKA